MALEHLMKKNCLDNVQFYIQFVCARFDVEMMNRTNLFVVNLILQSSDVEEIKLASVELFSQLVEVSPYVVREFIMHEAMTLEEVWKNSQATISVVLLK